MRLTLALLAIGAAAAALAAPSHADDGLPLPGKKTSTPLGVPRIVGPVSPEEDLALLHSDVAVLDATETKLEREVHVLKSVGLRGALGGEHDPIGELVWDIFTKKLVRKLDREIAAVESAKTFVAGQEAAAEKEIADAKAREKAAAEAAAAKAEAEARAKAAAAEQTALDQRIEQAVNNAKNAWKPDGIVNRNTGDHSWDMWCLALASTAWETALGHSFPLIDQDTAFHAYQACANAGLIHVGGVPPRGALVFWPAGSGDGHIAISNGDGTVVSNYNRNDAPTGINPAAPIENFGTPIGWVDPRDIK